MVTHTYVNRESVIAKTPDGSTVSIEVCTRLSSEEDRHNAFELGRELFLEVQDNYRWHCKSSQANEIVKNP